MLNRLALIILVCLACYSNVQAKGSDPTRPFGASTISTGSNAEKIAEGGLKLSAIMIKASGNYAVINGEKYRVGDNKFGVHVTKINKWQVTVSHKGKVLELPLVQQTVKAVKGKR